MVQDKSNTDLDSRSVKLTQMDKIKATIAKWIVVNVASRIHPLAVLSLCVETANKYHKKLEEQKEN